MQQLQPISCTLSNNPPISQRRASKRGVKSGERRAGRKYAGEGNTHTVAHLSAEPLVKIGPEKGQISQPFLSFLVEIPL